VGTLEATWRRIPVRTAGPTSAHDAPTYANRSLRADVQFALRVRELMRADPVGSRPLVRDLIRRVVEYCAKLGRRRRDVADDCDLFTVVPVGNLRSEILVVQSAQNWHRQRAADSLDGTRDRRVLVQR
jgi:hypothetical protein